MRKNHWFLRGDAIPARYMLSSCARLSVCLSQAGTVPTWLNAGSHKQRHMIAQGLYGFLTPKISVKFRWGYSQRVHQIEVG